MIKHSPCITLIALLNIVSLRAVDNAHFYTAPLFLQSYDEPRLAEPWLTTFEAYIAAGGTNESRRKCPDDSLLNLCGFHNMHVLGSGVPNKDHTNELDALLLMLEMLPGRDDFGMLKFKGDFNMVEGSFWFTQNFACGFFGQINVPFRHLEIECIKSGSKLIYTDESPTDAGFPNAQTIEWQAFLNSFEAILERYNLCVDNVHRTDIGDISFLLGWTINYEQTKVLDYIDATVRAGVLAPTGHRTDQDRPFDLATGHDGHVGIPLSVDVATGAYEWLTMGAHFDALIFLNDTRDIRLKTDKDQNGFIKLAKGRTKIDRGTLFSFVTYLKADHALRGFSAWVGYTYNHKQADTLTPCDSCLFPPDVANSDCLRQGWKMHTLHFMAEYDFSKKNMCIGPRVAVFYNWQVGGKHVFQTSNGGGMIGIDIGWQF